MWHRREILRNSCQTTRIIFNTSFRAVGLEQTAVCGEIKNGLSDSSEERKLASEPSGYFMMPHRFQRPGNERWASWNIPDSSWLQHRRKKLRRSRREEKTAKWRSLLATVCSVRADCQLITHQHTWSSPDVSLRHMDERLSSQSPSLCLAYLIIWETKWDFEDLTTQWIWSLFS